MNLGLLKIAENAAIAPGVYKMLLKGDCSAITSPGQFVNIKLEGFYTRRPISVFDSDDKTVCIVYKTIGEGTEFMSRLKEGAVLDVLTGLGNGFDTKKSGDTPLLIGGGVGAAPLYKLCKELISQGKHPTVLLGFNTKDDVILEADFRSLGVPVILTTADGSCGIKGFVTDVIEKQDYSYFYACGPEAMFAAVNRAAVTSGQLSYEAHMGCGFGACMSCSCKTRFGAKRVCKDGPVFEREEIIW